MQFTAVTLAALAAVGAFAAPAEERAYHDIVVKLTGDHVKAWKFGGFSPTEALSVTSPHNPGPFSKVQVFFSDNIKKQFPGIETTYRCALEDADGNRIITTRGKSIDFNFGDGNNPNPWTLKNGPFSNVKITCDPAFRKINPTDVNTVRVTLSDLAESGRQVEFTAAQVTQAVSAGAGGSFRTVQLTVGPGIDNQKLRCQIKDAHGNPILVNRGANVNKKTFGDGGKGAWSIDVAGDGIADVDTVTCDPAFK